MAVILDCAKYGFQHSIEEAIFCLNPHLKGFLLFKNASQMPFTQGFICSCVIKNHLSIQ